MASDWVSRGAALYSAGVATAVAVVQIREHRQKRAGLLVVAHVRDHGIGLFVRNRGSDPVRVTRIEYQDVERRRGRSIYGRERTAIADLSRPLAPNESTMLSIPELSLPPGRRLALVVVTDDGRKYATKPVALAPGTAPPPPQ